MSEKPNERSEFFTAEDFYRVHLPDRGLYILQNDAERIATLANVKLAPLLDEIERLKDENKRILKELNATTEGREAAYKEQDKLTSMNAVMKEALEFYSGTVEKQVEIWDKSLLIDRGDKAREALANCAKLEQTSPAQQQVISDMEKGE